MTSYTYEEKQKALNEANELMKSNANRLSDIKKYVNRAKKRYTTPILNEEDLKFLIEQAERAQEETND